MINKKIAVCLFGSIGTNKSIGRNTKNSFDKIKYLDYKTPLLSIKKNVIEHNNADVFIHSWSNHKKDEIIKLLNPKKYIFEDYKTFAKPFHSRKNHIWSRFYTGQVSNNLKKEYELENNFKYDIVLSSRMDLIWFTKLNLNREIENNIFASNWNSSKKYGNLGPYDKSNNGDGWGVIDPWFFSSSKNMDKFTQVFKNRKFISLKSYFLYKSFLNRFKTFDFKTNNYYISTHHFYYQQAINKGLKFEFDYFRGFDYEIYRHTLKPGWTNESNS